MYSDFTPKFAKKYAEIGQSMKDAFSSYIDEVKSGNFPESKHSFALKEDIDFNNLDKKRGIKMKIVKTINEVREIIKDWKSKDCLLIRTHNGLSP